ncbi:related to transport protein USO1 [Ustilago sp. UG-2017b]|nr:related to transport protein USO1 [Ustilago sp. UG-2017b]
MLHGFNILRQQYSNLAKPGGGNQSAINTIQTLADRLIKADEYQLSLEDRRAAVLALKGLSRDHNRAVGQHALPALLKSLQRDAKDEDTARALIECSITLCEVQLPEAAATAQAPGKTQAQAQNRRKQQNQGPPSGLQHTDVFLQEPGPLHCLLPLLAPHRAFYTRFASLQLLGSLLRNRPHKVQDHVLVAPGGCGAILECLAEGAGSSAEIVRNEALLLLPHLVYANADIQKLVAFEGAFEKLLDVCAAQGRIEGGIIVQDALEGLEALLRYNVSNQNYFRETLSIPMLAPLLFYPPGSPNNGLPSKHADHEYARQLEAFCFQDWDQQKVVNAKIVLDIAALLIAGQAEGRRANQAALLQCGMTKCLIDLALGSTAPASLKAQALHLLASLMQSSRANQDLLSSLLVQPVKVLLPPKAETPIEGQHGGEQQQQLGKDPTFASQELSFTRLQPRPAAVCLVETAIGTSGAKGGLGLRGAAIACFRSYVADNMEARLSIINGMLPEAAAEEDNATASAASPAGKILFEGITQNPSTTATSDHADAYIHLISTMLFSYLLRGSETAKSAARSIAIDPDGKVVKHVRAEKQGDNDDDDDDDDDDAPSSLIQVLVANLTLSERELADAVRKERASALGSTVSSHSYSAADWTRIMVGYLVLLSIWLHESPLSVRDFLSESATLQAVIQPVAQSSGVDPLIQGLAAFLLGVAYEFDTDPGKVAVTRATMHPILHSRIGADQFAVRIARISDDVRFRQVTPDILEKLIFVEEQTEADELRAKQQAEAKAAAAAAAASASPSSPSSASPSSASPSHPSTGDGAKSEEKVKTDEEAADKDLEVNGLGHLSKRRRAGLWFDWSFVEFWRLNSTLISRSITVDPASSSAREAAMPVELLDAQRQAEALRDTVAKQTREIEMLEKRRDQLSCTNTKQLEQLQIQLTKAQEELASSTPQLEALREEIEELKSAHAASLAAEQSRNHDLVQLLEEARKSEEECRGKVLQLTSEITRSSAGKPTQKELLALQKTNEELKRKYDQLLTSTTSSSTTSAASGGVGLKELLEARDLAESRARQISDLEAKLAGNLAETAASQSTEKRELQRRVHELEAQASAAKAERDRVSADQSTQLSAAKREKEVLETKLSELEKKLEECMFSKNPSRSHSSLTEGQQGRELEQANKEKEEISRENEDLLVLLEELTQKRKSDKARLRTKGELVSDDDDDEQTAD